jgi:hypothetical protein
MESLQTLVDANQRQGSTETQFYSVPNFLQVSVDEATGTNRAAKVNEKLDLDWHYIEANTRNAAAPKPKYTLQNMILHTAQGDVTYQRTVEIVNGEPQIFYWKNDPASGGAPICIEQDEFSQAANSKDRKDLFFSKQEEILAERFDSDSVPDLAESDNVSFEYDNTDYDMNIPPFKTIAQAAALKDADWLKEKVEDALQAALDAGITEITLPVPLGEAADGMNWPIGIMWYTAQEFIKTLPPARVFNVRFAIDKSKKQGERRDRLVQQIDTADEFYQQSSDFAGFARTWAAYLKPPARRPGFLY